jgi:hypothetical protein
VKTAIPGKRGKNWENRAGLDALSLKLLAEDFAPLDELADNLASRVMQYLLDGAGGNVLAELAALGQAGQKLRVAAAAPGPPREGESPRSRFFQSAPSCPPPFFVRLGRVYEAASRPLRFRMSRAFGDPGLDWLQVLLIEATQLTLHTWPPRCRPCPVLTAGLIEAMLEAEGHPRDLLVRAAFQPAHPGRRWFGPELEPVWESLPGLGGSAARHAPAVLAALSQSGFKQQLHALNLMKKCQAPPAAFLGKLFELARGRSRRVRAQAGALLAGAQPQALPFLREKATRGRFGERAWAARILWRAEGENARAFLAARVLAEKDKKVARALEELLGTQVDTATLSWDKPVSRKEKNEATRSAMMTGLAQLGVPPEQFLDRAGLLEESARGLAEGIPQHLSWFPFQRLPAVHWADNGTLVERGIVRWWLAQCCQRQSPEPGPLLRQYAARLQTPGREALGRFVLEAWISQDTNLGVHPTFLGSPLNLNPNLNLNLVRKASDEIKIRIKIKKPPGGSAIASKGVLALAGACAGAEAAPLVHRYLEEWYGRRAAQCRALLQMLAWVEHPSAAQLLRAVASGFRTASIQEEASRQADRLAERQGCAVAEGPCKK